MIPLHDQFVNENEYCVFALQRSGNHAIIEWKLANSSGAYCFLNSCRPGRNPFDVDHINKRKKLRLVTNIKKLKIENEAKSDFQVKNHLIYSYENRGFDEVLTLEFAKNKLYWLGKSENPKSVLILRDPLNNFASYYQHLAVNGNSGIPFDRFIKLWKVYAKEFIGDTDTLKNKVLINYNHWVASEDYQADIAYKLDMISHDQIQRIPRYGGGSSFSGLSREALNDKTDYHLRWQMFLNDGKFWKYLVDEEVIDLSRRIFTIDPVKSFIEEGLKYIETNYL